MLETTIYNYKEMSKLYKRVDLITRCYQIALGTECSRHFKMKHHRINAAIVNNAVQILGKQIINKTNK